VKLPRFWAKEEADATKPSGDSLRVAAWRWSETSLDEARRSARAALEGIRRRIATGEPFPERYAYTSRPVREEVLREIGGDGDGPSAAITRNVYGALVLNTARVMFVDSDGEPETTGVLGRLFGRKPTEDPAVARASALVAQEPQASVRVYKTFAGTRYLLTHDLFDPVSERARELMERLGADPKYIQLCRVQESFRARLTPKPWRCGLRPPAVRWPWADADAEAAMRGWLRDYERACAGTAVCRLVATAGSGRTHPEVAPLVRLHDDETGVDTGNALA
jgi:hypothetical protein